MVQRTCSQCSMVKPLTEFHRAAHGREGYAAECKTCHATRSAPKVRAQVLACRYCGNEFPNPARRGPDRKFCSPDCKRTWWTEERSRQRVAAPPRSCRKCGGPVAHRTGIPVCQGCRVDDRTSAYRRDVQLKSLYGISQADYDRLVAQQDDRCAICGAASPGSRGCWRVDHDRLTGKIRGLLCDNCNRGIGYLRHDPDILVGAVRYLAQHIGKDPGQWLTGTR